jgi:transposase InsO family protein
MATFKLDPSNLPKLSARGDNYADWRSAWTIAFKHAGVYKNAIANDCHVDDEAKDTQALVMILSSVHSDHTVTIANCASAHEAWNHLKERFDRDTGNSTIYQFRALTSLRYQDGEDLQKHLDDFHQHWTRMAKRCSSSKQSVAKAMKPIFESQEVKGSFFLATLPDTMDNIIDNLNMKDITKFTEIEPKMLDLAARHSLESSEQTAYYGKSTNRTGKNNSQNNEKECTWCKKYNFKFVGHLWADCKRLADHKAKKASSKEKDKPQHKSDGKDKRNSHKRLKGVTNARAANDDSDTDESFDSNDDEDVTAFTATAFNASGKRMRVSDLPVPIADDDLRSPQFATIDDSLSMKLGSAFAASSGRVPWIADSGASRHMSGFADDFDSLRPCTGVVKIVGDIELPIEGIGDVTIRCRYPDGRVSPVKLTNVLYSREFKSTRLFSWPYIRNKGFEMIAKGNNMFINSDDKHEIWAKFRHGAMVIQQPPPPEVIAAAAKFTTYAEFHDAIGHSNILNPQRLYKDAKLVPPRPSDFHCEACALSKSKQSKPSSLPTRPSTKPFDLIHSDLSGKWDRKSIGGSQYFVSFIDDYTRFSWVTFIARKSEAPTAIKQFVALVENQFQTKIKSFRSDNGGEYIASNLKTFFKDNGIKSQPSPAYSHESNGLAERFNRSITETARAMTVDEDHLPLWAEAVHTANTLRNIKPHSSLPRKITPWEALYNEQPSIGHLHPFGQEVYVHIPKEARKPGTKLLHRAEKGIMVGYTASNKIYRVYIPLRHVVTEVRHLKFKPYGVKDRVSVHLETSHDETKPSSPKGDADDIETIVPNSPLTHISRSVPSSPIESDSRSNVWQTPPQR